MDSSKLRQQVEDLKSHFDSDDRMGQRWVRKLEYMLTDCEATFDKFEENFKVNPRYAFEWAEKPMIAAATLELIAWSANLSEQNVSIADQRADFTKKLLQEVGQGGSSSHAHNAQHYYKLQALREFLSQIEYSVA